MTGNGYIRVKSLGLINDGRRQHVVIDNFAWLTLPSGVFCTVHDEGPDVVATVKTLEAQYLFLCDREHVNATVVGAPARG